MAGCASDSGGDSGSTPPAAITASALPGTPSSQRSSGPTPSDSQLVAVTVESGKVTPKPGRVKVAVGRPVVLRVTSDVADEVHLHGYDLTSDVEAGGTATIRFTPDAAGIYEVELESSNLRLLELQVS